MRLMLSAMAGVKGLSWCYRNAAKKSSGLEARLEMEVQSENCYRSVRKGAEGENDGYVTLKDGI